VSSAVGVTASIALSLGVGGVLAWVLTDPHHWFPGAYAQRGDQGPVGPRGPRGLAGPRGPVGPDASDAINEIGSRLDDLEGQVSSLQDDLETLSDHAGGSQLEADVEDVQGTVQGLCDELSLSEGALYDLYLAAC
jgi:hypothetical protein